MTGSSLRKRFALLHTVARCERTPTLRRSPITPGKEPPPRPLFPKPKEILLQSPPLVFSLFTARKSSCKRKLVIKGQLSIHSYPHILRPSSKLSNVHGMHSCIEQGSRSASSQGVGRQYHSSILDPAGNEARYAVSLEPGRDKASASTLRSD